MRIVTRPDFDGVVCAVLLTNILDIDKAIKWVEPADIQRGLVDICRGDIIANLPYDSRCSLWFDHHCSNKPIGFVDGAFKIAPSAAGVIYEHYKGRILKNFDELVYQTDKIDSADLVLDEILNPEKYHWLLLSMTISGTNFNDEFYWNKLVKILNSLPIEEVMMDSDVALKCEHVIRENMLYKKALISNTSCRGSLSITDFRSILPVPRGNRFLVHSLFPDCSVNVKVFFDKKMAIISASKSILKQKCVVNLGKMFTSFGGGGHDGAGACSFHKKFLDDYLNKIISILMANKTT